MRDTDPAAFRAIVHHATSEALIRAQALGFSGNPTTSAAQNDGNPSPSDAFVGIIPALIKITKWLLLILMLLMSSMFLYGVFYVGIMPGHSASEKLYFDYSGISKHPVKSPVLPKTHIRYQSPHVLNNAPWAVADFFSRHSQWEGYEENSVPDLFTSNRVLKPGKMYDVGVRLDIPESEVNLRSGVISVMVEMQSSDGTMLATSVRSTRLPHETEWVSTIRKGISLAPLLIGAVEEVRTVEVPSFRYLVENEELPLRYATVTLLSQENKPIEVMTGSISIGEELSPLQLLLKEWFFTCYAAGTAFLFCTQGMTLLAAMALMEHRRNKLKEEEEEVFESPSLDLGSDVESRPQYDDENNDPEEPSRSFGSDVESQDDGIVDDIPEDPFVVQI